MANFFDVLKIKKSFTMGTREEDLLNADANCHKKNKDAILSAIYTRQIRQVAFSSEVAARWCVSHYLNISDDELTYFLLNDYVFYVLVQSDNGNREAVNILKDLPSDLSAFLDKYRPLYKTKKEEIEDGRKDEAFWKQYWKDFYSVAASVFAKIKNVSKGKTIIGYTLFESLANRFSDSLNKDFISGISEEELRGVWNTLSNGYFSAIEQLNFFNNIIGKKHLTIPSNIMGALISKKYPFESIEWKLINHQLKYDEAINVNVYKCINKFKEIQEVLKYGDFLEGLNLGRETQLGIIQRAITLGTKPDGTLYVDELYTANGWKSEEEMREIYDSNKEQMEQARLSPRMEQDAMQAELVRQQVIAQRQQNEFQEQQLALQRQQQEQQREFQKQQLEMQKAQIDAQKAAARATIDAQIAQLKAQRDRLFSIRTSSTASSSEKGEALRQYQNIDRQIRELESKRFRL